MKYNRKVFSESGLGKTMQYSLRFSCKELKAICYERLFVANSLSHKNISIVFYAVLIAHNVDVPTCNEVIVKIFRLLI